MMTTQEVLQTIFESGDTNPEDIKKRYPYFKLIHLYNYLKDPQSKQNRQMAGLHFTQHYWLQGLTTANIAESNKEESQNDFRREEPVIFPHETVLDEVMNSVPQGAERPNINRISEQQVAEAVEQQAEPVEQLHEVDDPLPTGEPVTINDPFENAEEAPMQSLIERDEASGFEVKKNDEIYKPSAELAADLEIYQELIEESENEETTPEQEMKLAGKGEVNSDGDWQHTIVEQTTMVGETALVSASTLFTEKPQVHEVENPLPAEEPVSVNEPRKSLNDTPSPHLQLPPKDDTTTTDTFLFEPLHTTDYFASQGIKITDEAMSTDKIGKQLKSFTQWLKTMKRLPGTPDQNINKGKLDTQVVSLAENSNREEEIVTESMAKAYLQQGKIAKAREIYRKLSLIYPEKSTYFAALIEKS